MKKEPLVSILMNCYNGETYLKEAIDSIYAQTFQNFEIIFIDNCSIDKSTEIAKSYDERLKYYKTEKNISLGAARNFGMKFVTGDYLAFLDTDDAWLEQKLEMQLKVINKNIAFVYSPVYQINSKNKIIRTTKINKIKNLKSLLVRYDINMHSTLINLSLIKVQFNETFVYCPDYDLFMNIVVNNLNYESIDIPLVKYRIHDKSLSTKTTNIQFSEVLLVLKKIKLNYPLMYTQNINAFLVAEGKFKYIISAKKFLSKGEYLKASEMLLKLSKYDKKYFIISIMLAIPKFNNIVYKKYIYKYV